MREVERPRIRDLDIRRALGRQLDLRHGNDADTLIIQELGLCQGTARVDVAVINGSIHGFEIKSDADNLQRLSGQEAVYSSCLDCVTVIASERHIPNIAGSVPVWWGLWSAKFDHATIEFEEVQASRQNPEVSSRRLVELLWRNEVLGALEHLGLDKGLRRKPRNQLWDALSEALSPRELRTLVRECLKARRGWRSPLQPA